MPSWIQVFATADEDLEGHVSVGARVPGAEDDAHVPASDLVGDLEVRPAMVGSGVVPFTGAVPQRVLRAWLCKALWER